jgi:hypothetical protein
MDDVLLGGGVDGLERSGQNFRFCDANMSSKVRFNRFGHNNYNINVAKEYQFT